MHIRCTHQACLFACTIASAILLGPSVHATSPCSFPWENKNSVRAALAQQEGRSVVCVAAVALTAARNNPPYFVLKDEFRISNDPASRIVVLCRPPVNLNGVIRVTGTLGRLPGNNEPCILDPTVEGLFDENGRPVSWTPFFAFMTAGNWRTLPIPTGPIAPSDPSLADDGTGVAGEVSAFATRGVSRYETVASLLSSAPSVLSCVELSAKPIAGVGEGCILVGDDNSDSIVKVYTNVAVNPKDRIIKLTGVVHSEGGRLCLYAGNGVSPYYDAQGLDAAGGVSVASPGSVAYVATLSDLGSSRASSSGARIMSVGAPSSSDGSWVYLTGQVVSYIGHYYSYDIPNGGWINVYDIQGVDRTPGIRVWSPAYYNPNYVGSIVDVMAKVDTKDGQRMLGIWSSYEWNAIDLSSPTHCIEAKILAPTEWTSPPPNVVPVGMNNRDLGGTAIGNNPGVTGAHGMYNIGCYVTVWGKVLEAGTYQFDQNYSTVSYMRIDDGAGVLSGNSSPSYGGPYGTHGVTVFGTDSFGEYDPVEVGDYVSVTGASSIWKPCGSTDTYRCVWTSNYATNQIDPSTTRSRQVTATGTISGTVKVYDMPDRQATVKVCCSNGQMATRTVTRQSNGSGSAAYTFTGIPLEVEVTTTQGISQWTTTEYPEYIVSAKCEGYKTRTYTQITPWTGTATPRNLYLTRLRKIYVMTDNVYIDSDPGGTNSTVITATVRDADHNPVQGLTVRFRTDNGSFQSGSIVHEYTPMSTTNSQGQVTATLYGVPSEWGDAIVEATDDSAPLMGDAPGDDPYKYDWEQLHDQYGQPVNITINQPPAAIDVMADPTTISRCGNEMSTITATVTVCGAAFGGADISFVTDRGVFDETGTAAATATTNASGVATVHLKASTDGEGIANVAASATVCGIDLYGSVQVVITHDKLTLTADPFSVPLSQSTSRITAKLATPTGVPITGKHVTFATTAGSLSNITPSSGNTDANGEVKVTLDGVSQGGFAVVEATTTNRCDETIKQRCQVDFLQSAADDWPMFMRDSRHQGYARTSDGASITDFGEPVWTQPIDTATTARGNWTGGNHPNPAGGSTCIFEHPYIDSSPVHASDCSVIVGAWVGTYGSYLNGSKGYLAAFDPTTGALEWDYPAGAQDDDDLRLPGGISSTPAIATVSGQKRVYFGCMDGKVYCLNASTGALVWSFQTKKRDNATAANLIQSPVVYNGVVYIGNESARVYALNASDGTAAWASPYDIPTADLEEGKEDISGVSSVAVANIAGQGRLYFGCDNGYLYCLNASTKAQVWSYRPDHYGCIESSPTIYAGNVYFGITFYQGVNLFAVNATSGEQVWTRQLMPAGNQDLGEEVRATCAAMDNAVYVGEDTGHLFYRVNAQTGEIEPDPNQSSTNPFHARSSWYNYFVGSAAFTPAGYGIVGNDNGTLYALDKNDVDLLAYYDTSYSLNSYVCSSPAISYATQSGYKWIYVVSRSDDGRQDGRGTLYAFRQNKN